jgi:hypothetical protein
VCVCVCVHSLSAPTHVFAFSLSQRIVHSQEELRNAVRALSVRVAEGLEHMQAAPAAPVNHSFL